MEKLTLKDLVTDHDYYCSDSNYYSNEASLNYDKFSDFYEEFHDADVDINLVFRWDLKEKDREGTYYLQIFMIKQRKGIFMPITIDSFVEKDVETFVNYILPHIEKIKSIWKPFKF